MKYECNGCEDSCTLETEAEDIKAPREICPWGLHCNQFTREIGANESPCMWVPVDPGVDTLTDAMEGRR